MILSDFHVHTSFCDGRDSPEEIVQEALRLGMRKLGFSGHAHTPFDEEACMSVGNTRLYREEILRLKAKYSGQIEILCGIEQDYYSDMPTDGYDYVIGSVHYVEVNGKHLSVDDTPEILDEAIRECGGADVLAEKYFALEADVVRRTGADIIGHFDLLAKFGRIEEDSPRYIDAAVSALDVLLAAGKPFEINTGAVARGYKSFPYPSMRFLKYIAQHGGRVILSSDSHSKDTLMYGFREYEALAESLGLAVIEL